MLSLSVKKTVVPSPTKKQKKSRKMKFLVYRQNWHPVTEAEHCISASITPFESYELDEVLVTKERLMEMLTKSTINVLIKVSGTDHADKIRTMKEMEEDKDNLAKDYHYAVHISPATSAEPAVAVAPTTTIPPAVLTSAVPSVSGTSIGAKIEFPAVGIYKLVEVPGRVYGVWRTLIPTEKLTLCQIPECKTDDIFDRQNGYRPSLSEHKAGNTTSRASVPAPPPSSTTNLIGLFQSSNNSHRRQPSTFVDPSASSEVPQMVVTMGMLKKARSQLKASSPRASTIETTTQPASSASSISTGPSVPPVSPLMLSSLKFFNK